MNTLRRLTARLRNLLTRQTDQERFLEEMDEHISRQTEENLRSGMSPTEARRHALLKFGAVEAIRKQYHSEKSLPLIESVVSDIRYSVRILRKTQASPRLPRRRWPWRSEPTRQSSLSPSAFFSTGSVCLIPSSFACSIGVETSKRRFQTCGALLTTHPNSVRQRFLIRCLSNCAATITCWRTSSPSKTSAE